MEREELMIGDWVMYDPNVFIEDEYEPTHPMHPAKIESGEDIDCAINDCYSPIPFTAEILEKNGFHPLYDDLSAYKLFWSDEKEENYWSITIDLTHTIASRIENHIMRTGKKSESGK